MAGGHCNRITREEYRRSVRQGAAGNFVCIHCGKSAYRHLSGTNKAQGLVNKYCSMACRVEYAKARNHQYTKITKCVCHHCGKEWWDRRKKRYCSDECQKKEYSVRRATTDWSALKCKCCGDMFVAERRNGSPPKYCKVCDPIAKEASVKRNRRASKARRKALLKASSVDRFDPYDVFDRDKWRCKLCGVRTPKAKRGTCDDDAPELDHIIPLSVGGDHSKENTQCACRKCNREKSDTPLGQLLMFG